MDQPDILETSEQVVIAQRLQTKFLRHMEYLFDNKEISSTDLATVSRLLSANGWVLDSTRLPSRLKDKLTSSFDPETVDGDDNVIPIRAAGGKKQ
jgi:hypothetical protein